MFPIVLLLIINTSFTQSIEKQICGQDLADEQIYFTLKDSVNTTAFVYNNEAAYKSVKTGLISGAIGVFAGLATVYISTMDDRGCDLGCAIAYTVVPIAAGGTSFLVGTTIGYLKNYNRRTSTVNHSNKRMPFKHLGFNTLLSFATSNNYTDVDDLNFKYGISYRNLYKSVYIPNKISLLYGRTTRWYHYKKSQPEFLPIWTEETTVGIEAVHINFNKLISLLYGLEAGVSFVESYKSLLQGETADIVRYKNLISPYFDFVIGFNTNIFSFLSWEFAFKYEPFGVYNMLKPRDEDILSQTHKIETSLMIYLY